MALSVSELTSLVSRALSARPELEDVLVEGELSNIKAQSSGHLYFTLKDTIAQVSCVCWRTNALRIPFQPENGTTVVAHGQVQVYEQQGRYQLYVDRLEPSGIGALALATEQLKKRLALEGLFDERVKRRLPLLPRRVVVVTSRTGAAFRDVVTAVTRRATCIDVILSPATVQGDGAAETIVTALRRADSARSADVILLVRGGGSFEDLMPFNSEIVARAIRATHLPVVTGIGHETDTTIADLAADRRTATPSAAAEVVAPSAVQLRGELNSRWLHLGHAVSSGLAAKRRFTEVALSRLNRESPANRISGMRQEVDRRTSALRRALTQEVASKRRRLDVGRLEALSPQRTLERGYSITIDETTGKVLTDAGATQPGHRLRTLLNRGELASEVIARKEPADTDGEQMYDAPLEP